MNTDTRIYGYVDTKTSSVFCPTCAPKEIKQLAELGQQVHILRSWDFLSFPGQIYFCDNCLRRLD